MKFNVEAVKQFYPDESVQVGHVYSSKNHRVTRYWLVLSVRGNTAHLLGLDATGEVVTTTSYGVHALDGRALVGVVKGLEELSFSIEPVTL